MSRHLLITYKPGTYTATSDTSFTINRSNVVILGGYPTGGGIRDPAVNVVILKGQLRFLSSAQFDGFKLQDL
jgi:hypothetical protein